MYVGLPCYSMLPCYARDCFRRILHDARRDDISCEIAHCGFWGESTRTGNLFPSGVVCLFRTLRLFSETGVRVARHTYTKQEISSIVASPARKGSGNTHRVTTEPIRTSLCLADHIEIPSTPCYPPAQRRGSRSIQRRPSRPIRGIGPPAASSRPADRPTGRSRCWPPS